MCDYGWNGYSAIHWRFAGIFSLSLVSYQPLSRACYGMSSSGTCAVASLTDWNMAQSFLLFAHRSLACCGWSGPSCYVTCSVIIIKWTAMRIPSYSLNQSDTGECITAIHENERVNKWLMPLLYGNFTESTGLKRLTAANNRRMLQVCRKAMRNSCQ